MDEIVFDYDGRTAIVGYIVAMVGDVRKKARQMGLTRILPAPQYVFRMSKRLWEGVFFGDAPCITVDGIRYPVELDEAAGDSIWFVPQGDDFRNRPSVAVLRNVGESV